jgi:hypothetical protein
MEDEIFEICLTALLLFVVMLGLIVIPEICDYFNEKKEGGKDYKYTPTEGFLSGSLWFIAMIILDSLIMLSDKLPLVKNFFLYTTLGHISMIIIGAAIVGLTTFIIAISKEDSRMY